MVLFVGILPFSLTWVFLHKGVNVNSGPGASCVKHDAIKGVGSGIYKAHTRWKETLKPHLWAWMGNNAVDRGKGQH